MSVAFGIDLGTTRTSIAFIAPNLPGHGSTGGAQVVELSDGRMTPSAVLFERDAEIYGTAAKNAGHRARDCAQIFKREMSSDDWTFRPASRPGAAYSPEQLSSMLLRHVSAGAATATGRPVDEVVITVPAYFGEPERQRTRSAAASAGLSVLDIINEPTAAILGYLFQPGVPQDPGPVLVFDLGGGTFDTVVVDAQEHSVRVAAMRGDDKLGGRDFDETIAFRLGTEFESQYPYEDLPTADLDSDARLALDVEAARESLSSTQVANIPVWGGGSSSHIVHNARLTRADLEGTVGALVDRCLEMTRDVLAAARARGIVATRVLFVGGTTRMPMIRRRVAREFELDELTLASDPDLLVAKGAAVWAQKLVLERKVVEGLGVGSIAEVDWTAPASRALLNTLVAETAYDRRLLQRLLSLSLESVSSHGYAIKVRDPATGSHGLSYLLAAGDPLPYEGEPRRYRWSDDVESWRLEIYEDAPTTRATDDPAAARLVEVARGAMSRRHERGEKLYVRMSMGRDQILRLEAWHEEAGERTEEFTVALEGTRP